MADPLVFYALKRKHAEIAGELRRLDAQLIAIEEALRLCGYRGDFSEIKPVLRRRKSLFGRGELSRLVLDTLRERRCAPFDSEIAAEIIRAKGWQADPELLASMVQKVRGVRRRLRTMLPVATAPTIHGSVAQRARG